MERVQHQLGPQLVTNKVANSPKVPKEIEAKHLSTWMLELIVEEFRSLKSSRHVARELAQRYAMPGLTRATIVDALALRNIQKKEPAREMSVREAIGRRLA
jgi:hypothetical protein